MAVFNSRLADDFPEIDEGMRKVEEAMSNLANVIVNLLARCPTCGQAPEIGHEGDHPCDECGAVCEWDWESCGCPLCTARRSERGKQRTQLPGHYKQSKKIEPFARAPRSPEPPAREG